MAWLSTKLSESEQAVAVAEQQRDAAFLYNYHNSAATVIQRFARTRSCRNATRVLLSQSSHRSTQDKNAIEALNVALTGSSDRLEVAVSEVQTLLSEALSREVHTAQLLNEERALNSALREEAAAKILETARQTRSKLLAEHAALQTQQDTQHYAASTIQRALRQRSALHDIRSVVRASQARLAREQAEVLRGKAVLEETRDELATANAMNESALEQLASEIQNGRERAAAAKIQVG
jgi:chromosome segregation ATPase